MLSASETSHLSIKETKPVLPCLHEHLEKRDADTYDSPLKKGTLRYDYFLLYRTEPITVGNRSPTSFQMEDAQRNDSRRVAHRVLRVLRTRLPRRGLRRERSARRWHLQGEMVAVGSVVEFRNGNTSMTFRTKNSGRARSWPSRTLTARSAPSPDPSTASASSTS